MEYEKTAVPYIEKIDVHDINALLSGDVSFELVSTAVYDKGETSSTVYGDYIYSFSNKSVQGLLTSTDEMYTFPNLS